VLCRWARQEGGGLQTKKQRYIGHNTPARRVGSTPTHFSAEGRESEFWTIKIWVEKERGYKGRLQKKKKGDEEEEKLQGESSAHIVECI